MADHQVVHFHVQIRLKTSCPIGHEHSLFCCIVKHAIKSHVIVLMVIVFNWLLTYDLQVIFSVCANCGRIPLNRLGTLIQDY